MPPDDQTLAKLVRRLADPVIVADSDGIIVFWNDAAERVFGWTADHAIGMSLDLIIPDRQGGCRPARSVERATDWAESSSAGAR